MRASSLGRAGSSSSTTNSSSRTSSRHQSMVCRASSRHQSIVCRASGQLNRPPQSPQPLGRPQLPSQQQQQQTSQDQLLYPAPSSINSSSSSSSRLQQGPTRPGQLLSPPSRSGLSPQEQRRAARRLDDGDMRMAAYDNLIVQVSRNGVVQPRLEQPSFNKAPCQVRPFMAAAMKAAHVQRPTPVQGALMAAIASGRDVLSSAPPGAGSSTGMLLGLLTQLLSIPRSLPRKKAWPLALVLCPTRELALQLAAQASQFVAGSQLTVKCVTGGAPITQQVLDLRRGADVLVATPGRLMDLLGSAVYLNRLKFMVLEEVDELTGPALLPVTKQLLHHRSMPPYKQRRAIALGSSALPQQQLLAAAADVLQPSAVLIRATWLLPQQQQQQQQQQQVHSLADGLAPLTALLTNPAAALAAAAAATAAAVAPNIGQRFMGVAPQLKHRTLLRLLSGSTAVAAAGDGGGGGGVAVTQGPTVVFTNSAAVADEVVSQLEAAGVPAGALHHMRSQNQREEALQCFRFGVTQVLVACGVAYRGLDLPDVSLVVNYEVPLSLAEYARRVGLVGRQGREGTAVTLATPADGTAAVPLVALLTALGQAVPDWMAALAAGSSSGSSSGEGADAATAAADGTGAHSSEALVDASSSQQQQQSSGVFTALQQNMQFGGYSSSSSSKSKQQKTPAKP